MDVNVDTRYLTQDELTTLFQVLIRAGVRKEIERLTVEQREKIKAQKTENVKPLSTQKPTPRKYKKRMKCKRLTEKQIKVIVNGQKTGTTLHKLGIDTGLTKKAVRRAMYRIQFTPSDLMLKVLGKKA